MDSKYKSFPRVVKWHQEGVVVPWHTYVGPSPKIVLFEMMLTESEAGAGKTTLS
jgi:hypothetical protein